MERKICLLLIGTISIIYLVTSLGVETSICHKLRLHFLSFCVLDVPSPAEMSLQSVLGRKEQASRQKLNGQQKIFVLLVNHNPKLFPEKLNLRLL